MALTDDLSVPATRRQISRRRALGLLGSAAIGAAGAGTGLVSVSFLVPRVLYEPSPFVRLGKLGALHPGSVTSFPRRHLYVRRSAAGLYAMSAVCTHLGCLTRFLPAPDRIVCPCHGSVFDVEGRVLEGPATEALARYPVRVDEEEELVVDTSRTLPPGEPSGA